jgi:hypothetical protein
MILLIFVIAAIWSLGAFVQDMINYKPNYSKLKPTDVWWLYPLIPYIYCVCLLVRVVQKMFKLNR